MTTPTPGPGTHDAPIRIRRRTYVLALALLGVTVVWAWGPLRDGWTDQRTAGAESALAAPDAAHEIPEGATQNGWDAIEDGADPRLVPLPWVTGRVLGGDVHTLLSYFAERFDAEVEPIDPASSWGWAYRPVVGEDEVLSNHASGTAIDLNAPMHPIGSSGTFSDEQTDRLRALLDELAPVLVWGSDFDRPDEMHFDVVGTPEQVASVVDRLGLR